jgi:hypothetical protein
LQADYQHECSPESSRALPRWPLALIALPAAVAVWSGWVGLGQLCGFGIVHPLPGIVSTFRLNTAITLPVGVEAYASFALGAWLRPGSPERARKFAKRSAIGALALGMLGQVAYHVLAAADAAHAPWPVVVLLACLPVATLGFGVSLAHMLSDATTQPALAGSAAEPVSITGLTASGRPPISLAWPATSAPAEPRPRRTRRASGMRRTRSAPVTNEDAARRYAPEIAEGRIPSMRRVRSEMHVGQSRAQAIVAHLGALAEGAAA